MAINLANNSSLANITALPSSIIGGAMTLISEQTASGSATIDFTSGIDSTYDSYVFKFINIHPATDNVLLQFNMSTDGGSNYNVTKTSAYFSAYHNEAGNSTGLGYVTAHDLAQSTSNQTLIAEIGNDNDQSVSSYLQIFNPSSTTFVKHFISSSTVSAYHEYMVNSYVAGYGNTTSSINAVRFQMSSGNIDSGVIKLYGVS